MTPPVLNVLKRNSHDHKKQLIDKGVESRQLTGQKRLGAGDGKG